MVVLDKSLGRCRDRLAALSRIDILRPADPLRSPGPCYDRILSPLREDPYTAPVRDAPSWPHPVEVRGASLRPSAVEPKPRARSRPSVRSARGSHHSVEPSRYLLVPACKPRRSPLDGQPLVSARAFWPQLRSWSGSALVALARACSHAWSWSLPSIILPTPATSQATDMPRPLLDPQHQLREKKPNRCTSRVQACIRTLCLSHLITQ